MNNMLRISKLWGVFIIMFTMVVGGYIHQPVAHAQTAQCVEIAQALTEQGQSIFNDPANTGNAAQDYYEIYRTWDQWNNIIVNEGANTQTHYGYELSSSDGWTVNETVTNQSTNQQTVFEYSQNGNSALPAEFVLSNTQMDRLQSIESNQSFTWLGSLLTLLLDVDNFANGTCNINITRENIEEGFWLNAESEEGEIGNQEQAEGESGVTGNQGNNSNNNQGNNNGLPNETFIFGDGETPFDVNSAIINVPMINWNDQLAFRLRTQINDIQIFGVSIEALQNGTASLNDFNIQNLQNFEFNFFNNVTLADIITGNIFVGNAELPGVSIDGIEFFYDFYYTINAAVNLNGRSYDSVKVFFGQTPEELTTQIAEYQNVSGSFEINEQVYNINNDNQNEEHTAALFVDRPYYVGVYGSYTDTDGVQRQDTIAIKRLYTYVDQIANASRIIVNWNPSPYMAVTNTGSVIGNTVAFNLAGDMQVQNQTREEAYLKFGYDPSTFRKVQIYPEPSSALAGQNVIFQKQITNFYADAESFAVGRIEPNKMYYAGLYEGEELVYFLQVGRTPNFANPADNPSSETEEAPEEEGGIFNQNPFADLEQDLSTGIVPCDGLNVPCDYNQMINLLRRAMNFVFIAIIPIAAIAFTYAGFLLLFQGANPEKRKKARDIFIKVFIGIVVVLAAWLIVRTILVSLGVTQTWALIDLGN